MITEWETLDGHTLTLGRIPRQTIDAFWARNAPPTPPTKEVEAWAGIEQIKDHNAPEHKLAMEKYYVDTRLAQLDLIADVVDVASASAATKEVQSLGLAQTKASLLAFLVQDPLDIRSIVEIVLYNSTVTPQGITEAALKFGVKWKNSAVSPFAVPRGGAVAFGVYGDQLAARWCGYIWEDFCKLPGPRQSEVVALCRIDNLLQIASSTPRPKEVAT